MQLVEKNRPLSDDENVLVKAVNVLTVLGYTDLAKELGALADRVGRCVTLSDVYMNHIIDGAVKKIEVTRPQDTDIICMMKFWQLSKPHGRKTLLYLKENDRKVDESL